MDSHLNIITDNPLLDRKTGQIAEYRGNVVKLVIPAWSLCGPPSFEQVATVRWL